MLYHITGKLSSFMKGLLSSWWTKAMYWISLLLLWIRWVGTVWCCSWCSGSKILHWKTVQPANKKSAAFNVQQYTVIGSHKWISQFQTYPQGQQLKVLILVLCALIDEKSVLLTIFRVSHSTWLYWSVHHHPPSPLKDEEQECTVNVYTLWCGEIWKI